MQRIKLNVALLAFVLATTAVFAFKAPVKHFTNPYWAYDGTGSVTDPSNYTELSGGPSCGVSGNICAIMAPEDPNNPGEPQINSGLQTRIQNKDTSDHDVFLKQ